MAGLNISKVKFLVVEDNPFMKDLLRQILRTLGVTQIVEASDGAEGFELYKEMSPDIVLLDWQMEPMDGLELTKLIRGTDSNNRYVPIIMITAYSEIARVTLARDAGVNELLVKPIAATSLFTRIRAVIERPPPVRRGRDLFRPRSPPPPGSELQGRGPSRRGQTRSRLRRR